MADIKRKLATIQTIRELKPIEGADLIELATFTSVGWQCVVGKKDNLRPGDRVVYFEVDSVLNTEDPRFNFLEQVKGHIKTRRFKGIYSQGLALPLEAFPEAVPHVSVSELRRLTIQLPDGYDVTDALKVVKYEIPEFSSTAGDLKGPFPGFAEKSDEERGQNLVNLIDLLSFYEYDVSVKMDGTSGLFYLREGEFGVCSRNFELRETESNAHWKVARQYKIEERLRAYGINLALQGEVCGPGINKNRIGLTGPRLFIFTIQDLDKNERLTRKQMETLIEDLNILVEGPELELVPAVTNFQRPKTLEDLIALSDGTFIVTDKIREGIVLRAKDNPKVSFKVVSPKYLTKHDL